MSNIENIILVLSTSIAGTLLLIGGIITFIYAKRRKLSLLFLFSTGWLLQAIFWFLDSAAHYFYSQDLMRIAFILQSAAIPCIFMFIDLIKSEKVNVIKIATLAIIETFLILSLFLPGAMTIIPGYGVHFMGLSRLLQIIWLIYYVFFYFSWGYQTWKEAPVKLKRLLTLLLTGSILFSAVTTAFYAVGTFLRIFNPLGFIIHGVGALITIIVIIKDPTIIYILPFKAYRLIIFETKDGTALLKHDWAELRDVEENVFAMLLQATRKVLNEILDKGEVRKIEMDKAVLLIQYDKRYPIASVLVASKSCKSLRDGLKVFHDQFISIYYNEKEDFQDINKFKDARNLVKTIFEFIPEYIKKP